MRRSRTFTYTLKTDEHSSEYFSITIPSPLPLMVALIYSPYCELPFLSCGRKDCFIEYRRCMYIITCEQKYDVELL